MRTIHCSEENVRDPYDEFPYVKHSYKCLPEGYLIHSNNSEGTVRDFLRKSDFVEDAYEFQSDIMRNYGDDPEYADYTNLYNKLLNCKDLYAVELIFDLIIFAKKHEYYCDHMQNPRFDTIAKLVNKEYDVASTKLWTKYARGVGGEMRRVYIKLNNIDDYPFSTDDKLIIKETPIFYNLVDGKLSIRTCGPHKDNIKEYLTKLLAPIIIDIRGALGSNGYTNIKSIKTNA